MCPAGYRHKGFVPKCMSCHKAIMVIIGRAHCFHDCIYIMPILLLPDLSTLLCLLWIIYGHYILRIFMVIKM